MQQYGCVMALTDVAMDWPRATSSRCPCIMIAKISYCRVYCPFSANMDAGTMWPKATMKPATCIVVNQMLQFSWVMLTWDVTVFMAFADWHFTLFMGFAYWHVTVFMGFFLLTEMLQFSRIFLTAMRQFSWALLTDMLQFSWVLLTDMLQFSWVTMSQMKIWATWVKTSRAFQTEHKRCDKSKMDGLLKVCFHFSWTHIRLWWLSTGGM